MYLLTGSRQTKEIEYENKKKRLNSIQFNSMHINEEKIEKLRKLRRDLDRRKNEEKRKKERKRVLKVALKMCNR